MSEQQSKVMEFFRNLMDNLKKMMLNLGENKKALKSIIVLVVLILLFVFRFEIMKASNVVYFKLKQLFS